MGEERKRDKDKFKREHWLLVWGVKCNGMLRIYIFMWANIQNGKWLSSAFTKLVLCVSELLGHCQGKSLGSFKGLFFWSLDYLEIFECIHPSLVGHLISASLWSFIFSIPKNLSIYIWKRWSFHFFLIYYFLNISLLGPFLFIYLQLFYLFFFEGGLGGPECSWRKGMCSINYFRY